MRLLCFIALAGMLGACTGGGQGVVRTHAVAAVPAASTVMQPPAAFLQFVSKDTVAQISATLPAATQPLVLARPLLSPVQQYIVAGLREHGFAVEESSSVADARRRMRAGSAPGEYSRGVFKVDPVVLDIRTGAVASDLFYIRVDMGRSTLSRAYVLTADGATPAGAWVRRESTQ